MNKTLAILFSLFSASLAFAQKPHCGTDEYYKIQLERNPNLEVVEKQQNEDSKKWIETNKLTKRATKYIIPVVFHVIHTNGPENISRDQILDQIRVLNADYSYTNANKSNLRAAFTSIVGSADIEFRLASIDPNGNCFDGVNRVYSSTGVDMDMTKEPVKSLPNAYWNYKKYLNIWVVTNIVDGSGSASGTVLGYAVFPWMSATSRDGIVVRQDYVGTIGTAANGDGGRTLSHEIGHWLGLYHTFQGGCSVSGDACDDTPPVASTFTNATCPANGNSCTVDKPDMLDMWEDYMDYSDGKCMAAFTKQQIARMQSYLGQSPRSSNIAASNLTATGVVASSVAPIANFTSSSTTICAGQSVTFYDISCKGTPTTTSWTLTGSSSPSSLLSSPTVVYQTPGTYSVTLMAQNSYGSNSITKTNYITVLPAVSSGNPYTEEGFENGDPTVVSGYSNASPSGTQFQVTTKAAYTGTHSYVAPITTNSAAGPVYSFLTPSFNISKIPSTETPRFTFYCSYVQPSQSVTEILRIYISTDCGGTFKQVLERSGTGLAYALSATYTNNFVPTASTQWKRMGLGSLTTLGYNNAQNAIFRIDVISGGGNPVYLDNINMSPYMAGINTISSEKMELTLAPNPAQGISTLKVNNISGISHCKIKLYDMSGRLVNEIYNGDLNLNKNEFEIKHPNNETFGLFIVSVETELGTFTKPLIFSAE